MIQAAFNFLLKQLPFYFSNWLAYVFHFRICKFVQTGENWAFSSSDYGRKSHSAHSKLIQSQFANMPARVFRARNLQLKVWRAENGHTAPKFIYSRPLHSLSIYLYRSVRNFIIPLILGSVLILSPLRPLVCEKHKWKTAAARTKYV